MKTLCARTPYYDVKMEFVQAMAQILWKTCMFDQMKHIVLF